MATNPSSAFRDGDTKSLNGMALVRKNGMWVEQGSGGSGGQGGLEIVVPKPPPAGYTGNSSGMTPIKGGPADPYRPGGEYDPNKPPKDAPAPARIPVGAITGIQENLKALREIDSSLAALKGRPQSIGTGTGWLGDTVTQWNDPDGTDVRSRVANIGAVKIHDLSGAAVSASEAPRFTPFVPKVDDQPDVARKKLENFRENLKAQVKEQLGFYTPQNGFLPYHSPEADAFLAGDRPAQSGDSRLPVTPTGDLKFGDEGGPEAAGKRLSPEADRKFFAFLRTKPTGAQIKTKWAELGGGGTIGNADAIAKDLREGRPIGDQIDYSRTDIPVDEKLLAERMASTNGIDAGVAGGLDTASFGTLDEFGAAGDAFGGAMSGEGSFGDLFKKHLVQERAFRDALKERNPKSYLAGQVVGSLAVPIGAGARGAVALAKAGAIQGGAYGIGSTDGNLVDRVYGGAVGATAGAVVGGTLGKVTSAYAARAASKAGRDIPPLVDPATGTLNEPLEAAGSAGRVAAAKKFGIDLPYGSAGDKTAAIIERKLDVRPASAGVMNDARRVVEGQVQGATEKLAGKFGSSRTLNEGGAEGQRSANEWIGRADKLARKVYDKISIPPKTKAIVANTEGGLSDLTSKVGSNKELAEAVNDPTLKGYLAAIKKGGLDWQGLKEFRTFIGSKAGEFRFSQDARKDGYQALYGALSQDMRDTAAALGPKQLREFTRANNLYAAKEKRIEGALVRILGPDSKGSPEKAAAAIQAMTKGGKSTGDLAKLAEIRASTMKGGGWDEIAGTLIRIGGKPADSPGRNFDPSTFVRWYADMAEPARKMLFKPELRKSLDEFVAVNQRLDKSNALRNTSNTALASPSGTFSIPTGVALIATGHPVAGLAVMGSAGIKAGAEFGMSKLWIKPGFVNWATGYSRAVAAGKPGAVKARIGLLSKMAVSNPEIREPLIALQQKLLSGVNDNVGRTGSVAASPDQGPE